MGFQLGFVGGYEVYRRVSESILVSRVQGVGIYRGDLPCRIRGLGIDAFACLALEFRTQGCFALFLWVMVSGLMAKDRISVEFPGLRRTWLESLKVECIKT